MLAAYTPAQRRALAAAPLLLLVLTAAISLHPTQSPKLDVCYINRAVERPGRVWIPVRDGPLHNYSVYIMWAASLVLALLPVDRALGLYALLYASAWFHGTYVLLAALKAPLGDTRCAGRHANYPNGISGHYCYFLFVTLTLRLLARQRLRRNPRASSAPLLLIAFCVGMYTIGAAATLYRTFAHGYHSMRQIFLGSAMGLASHAALEAVLADEVRVTGMQFAWLATQSLTAFSLYQALWPTEAAGHAIPPLQIAFHLSLYLGMLLAARASMKQSKLPDKTN